MATNLENLATIKANALAKLAELTADPKPDYDIDGQKVTWSALWDKLTAICKWADKQIAYETGPVEIESVMEDTGDWLLY